MGTKTIRLERSAYDLLRSRRRPGESFSAEIHRLLGNDAPALREFLTFLPDKSAATIADAVEAAREEDRRYEERRAPRRKLEPGTGRLPV